ncbi:hypothetical protein ABZU32_23755 [Sphaerisporangium sp. NPDC005288]|uniref:hypothetical protein n=1 Tax=Sphaerisporangium sp. NPDC005288 TaxID=3155114 RepID=UPI0033A39815
MSLDVPTNDALLTPAKTWPITKRLSAAIFYLVVAAVLLGVAALGLAFAWHIFTLDSRYFAFSVCIAILAVRWVALYGIGSLIIAISAPFCGTDRWASTENADSNPRSGDGRWYVDDVDDVDDFGDLGDFGDGGCDFD